MLLGKGNVVATFAVKDINSAKKFYGETLGLRQTDESPGGVTYTVGNGRLFVYQSPTAGSGQATAAAFEVGDVKATVKELKAKGVPFQNYDNIPGGSHDSQVPEVHVMGPMQAAWFTDPDGNILLVGNSDD